MTRLKCLIAAVLYFALSGTPFGALLGVGTGMVLAPAAHAQNAPALEQGPEKNALYTVENILVRAMGNDGSQARNKAIRYGQIQTLREIIKRTVPQQFWDQVPTPNQRQFEGLMSGIDVVDEQQDNNSYLANVTIRFSEANLRGYLSDHSIPMVRPQEDSVAILLTYVDDFGIIKTFDPSTPWEAAWQPSPLANTPLESQLVGTGSNGQAFLADENALNPGVEDLEAFKQAYQTNAVLFSKAEVSEGRGSAISKLSISTQLYGELPGPNQINDSCLRNQNEDLNVFFRRCALAAVRPFLEVYKQTYAVDPTTEEIVETQDVQIQRLPVFSIVASNPEYAELQARVLSVPGVQDFTALEVQNGGLVTQLDYLGALDAVVLGLQQKGVQIFQSEGIIYLQIMR